MKRIAATVFLLVIASFLSGCHSDPIGTIKGAEWDHIIIDNIVYTKTSDSGLSISDKGKYLGKVTDGGHTVFKVYSVKDDESRNYIYCMWDWEGLIYKKR